MERCNSSSIQSSSLITCKSKAKGAYLKDLNPVSFDPLVDPEFGNCFNCWESGHTFQKCLLPKTRNFCYNCGRVGERVDTCPRCHQAHQKYWNDRKPNSIHEDSGDTKCDEEQIEGESKELKSYETSMDEISNSETEEDYSTGKEEDDYDNLIVDENQKSPHSEGYLVGDFVNLINMIKHLPIETQNTIVLHFVAERCICKELNSEKVDVCDARKISNFDIFIQFAKDLIKRIPVLLIDLLNTFRDKWCNQTKHKA